MINGGRSNVKLKGLRRKARENRKILVEYKLLCEPIFGEIVGNM